MQNGNTWSDHRLALIISAVLRAGVAIAAAIVFGGGIYYLTKYALQLPNYRGFHGEPSELRSIPGIIAFTLHGHARGIIGLGLLLLILTPVARVLLSVIGFARQRDLVYVVITLIVLAILIHNLVIGMF